MKIVVLPKRLAKEFIGDEPWAAISISTYPTEFANLNATKRIDLLRLCFADVNKEEDIGRINALVGQKSEETCFFDFEHAAKIIAFVQGLKDKGCDLLLVHCEAGVSRSPAIAAALHKIFVDNDDNLYFKRYQPNSHVYKTILQYAFDNNLIK